MSDAARQDTAFLEPLLDVGAVGLSDSRPRALGCLRLLASAQRNFLLLLDGVKAAVRFSRPTCLAAAVACGVPVGSELLAFIQTPQTRETLRCRRDQRRAAWHGPANRRAARLRDLLCAAEPLASATDGAICSSSTRRAHHQALSFCTVNRSHSPQRCSLSSSPLASLSSRHNSNCRSTLRSWISTALLVRTDKRRGTRVLLTKKKKHFSLQVVPLHCARASRRLHSALAFF
jgi:hypothetical protein